MSHNRAIRRKDTTRGPPLRILSLDGGGVRGYSMLIIIQELMHRTYVETEGKAPRRDQIPKPADHFDLIIGTGTGGLIAIMLGRLRLDLETCKEVYVQMTRKVFETDKTIAGIPFRSTLFKASRLEEAIRQCVREHTILAREGNDGEEPEELAGLDGLHSPISPLSPGSRSSPRRHASNASVASFSARGPASHPSRPMLGLKYGNPNALLYDDRENRTKTCVTAVYQGTPRGGPPAVLRSYDSRKEPPPEFDCTIWQAGRATSATGLAFKPIQIGQSVFIDEGAGQFNPAPVALDEACVNEWPGRDVGVLVSIGTGKRPPGSDQNSQMWYEGFMGEFAEARRRLVAKIEGCETTHQYLVREGLTKRGVNIENYYRFNVEVGVGEFGMNEWNRLADISTGTRRYLAKSDVQRMNLEVAAKLAKILRAKARHENEKTGGLLGHYPSRPPPDVPEAYPNAIELPADVPIQFARSPPPRPSYESGNHDSLEMIPGHQQTPSPRTSRENPPRHSPPTSKPSLGGDPNLDRRAVHAPPPSEYVIAGGADAIAITSSDEQPHPHFHPYPPRIEPPPLPPKTPLQDPVVRMPMGRPRLQLPYPVDDRPPPVANMARKPRYEGR
ncbi:hypothetical protein QTJ16_005357 [Diplocarpon rosae]|uniref:PNPLA domain-containing protein n=1 Tax=Diplocarpon rosae TaxID=946125 RepID=A0AAD9SXL5_9HELO|nr:hypothetical protein QTJ16_005357 [Diplocarpon rosae]